MQAGPYLEYKVNKSPVGNKSVVIITEIGYSQIDTVTSFVEYIYEKYGFSRSCVWYNLKKLKQMDMVDFAEREEMGKPLELTKLGINILRRRYTTGLAVGIVSRA